MNPLIHAGTGSSGSINVQPELIESEDQNKTLTPATFAQSTREVQIQNIDSDTLTIPRTDSEQKLKIAAEKQDLHELIEAISGIKDSIDEQTRFQMDSYYQRNPVPQALTESDNEKPGEDFAAKPKKETTFGDELAAKPKIETTFGDELAAKPKIETTFGEDTVTELKKESTPGPSTSAISEIDSNSETQVIIEQEVTDTLNTMTEVDVTNIKSLMADIPLPKEIANSEAAKQLKEMAAMAISLLDQLQADDSGKMICKPCSASHVFNTSAETVVLTSAYIAAVINLTAFVVSAYEQQGEINGAVVASALQGFFAAGSSGFMYLQGTMSMLDSFYDWNDSKNENGTSASKAAYDSLSKFISGFKTPSGLLKRVFFGTITGFSVYLDAKNTRFGMAKITGSDLAGKVLGTLNGLSESLVPLFQLNKTWDTIFGPFTACIRGSMHSKTELFEITQQIKTVFAQDSENPDINTGPSELSLEGMKAKLAGMSDKEKSEFNNLCENLLNDTDKVASELGRYIKGNSIKSLDSRVHAGFLFGIQSLAITLTGLFVSAVMSVPTKYSHYAEQLASCQNSILEALESGTNTDFGDSTKNLLESLESMDIFNVTENNLNELTEKLPEVCNELGFQMAAYPALQNALNITSYFLIAPALYMCFKNSFIAGGKLMMMPVNYLSDDITPSKKVFASNILAIGTSLSYATIIYGVKSAIEYVTAVEDEFNIDTSLIPASDFTLWMAIIAVVLTLYGGAQGGFKAVMDRFESQQFTKRSIETVPTDTELRVVGEKTYARIGRNQPVFEEPLTDIVQHGGFA